MAAYLIKLERDDDGSFLVTSPDFPELTSFGEDEADALAHARDALEEALAARISDWRDVPAPQLWNQERYHLVSIPALSAIKLELYRACKENEITRAELCRRLGWARESVDRLFRLDHASKVDQLEEALHAVGLDIEIKVRQAA